ncbi:hypothetical protein Tco_0258807, partial [Tanacetum coccineum]
IVHDEELALILHAEEQAELEKERVAQEEANIAKFIEQLDNIQAMIKADENRICAYLKNMGGYKHNQLKGISYEEIQKLFDKEYKQVNSFVPMDSEVVKSSETRTEGSSKRAGDELESDKSKKRKIDKHVEAEKDDD